MQTNTNEYETKLQQLQQLQSNLSTSEMLVRRTRKQLDEMGVSEVPANVKRITGIRLAIWILLILVLFVAGFILVYTGFRNTTAFGPFQIILGICSIVGGVLCGGKMQGLDTMVDYNEQTTRVQNLKTEITNLEAEMQKLERTNNDDKRN